MIKLLLSVETLTHNGKTILEIWEVGGKQRFILAPFLSYFYSFKPMGDCVLVEKRLLSNVKTKVTLYKVSFLNTESLSAQRGADTIEDNIPYRQRVAIDIGFKFPSEEPKQLAWDIESKVLGYTPNPFRDEIKCIGAWPTKFYKKGRKEAIKAFLKHVKKEDPDIITDFYGRFYDMPLLMAECGRLGIKCELGRGGALPYILKREFERRGKGKRENTVRIGGRVHFDVHKRVDMDYSLTLAGLKSRSLNETSLHFGLNPITDINHAAIPDNRLKEVNLDDTRCTYGIAETYLAIEFALAELLDLPLNMVLERSPSHIANYIYGRAYKEKGIVSDGANYERWPQIFKKGQRACQGAFIKCYKEGLYFDVWHKDWQSLYPSIMIAFNLDPETLTLIDIKPYTGKYRFEDHGDYAIVEVPDKVEKQFARQVIVRIDLSFDSTTRLKLQEFLDKRYAIKKQLKKGDNPKLEAQQNALKVMANAIFGYHIMYHARWGCPLVGILTTAIARLIIQNSMVGSDPIEVDTDGWYEWTYTQTKYEPYQTFPKCFKLGVFKLNEEHYDAMLSIDRKSYLLYRKGKIIKHGSGLLGRHHPRILDRFLEELCQALFNKRDHREVFRKYGKLFREWKKPSIITNPELPLFVMTVTMSKHPRSYNKTTMYAGLVRQYRKRNLKVRWGDKIRYVKSINGYRPLVFLQDGEKLDYSYYLSRLATVASRILKVRAKTLIPIFHGQTELYKK